MTTTAPATEAQTFTVTEEINVRASLQRTFDSLLANMGRLNEAPDGSPLPMVLEPHPGGRAGDMDVVDHELIHLLGRAAYVLHDAFAPVIDIFAHLHHHLATEADAGQRFPQIMRDGVAEGFQFSVGCLQGRGLPGQFGIQG